MKIVCLYYTLYSVQYIQYIHCYTANKVCTLYCIVTCECSLVDLPALPSLCRGQAEYTPHLRVQPR